ncbi:exonuclease domain-containing protein [Burkholderia gladioli]|uniref:3'-5' exonuclease n=1 Tax=Burkholderia gladioli TaxID=28095 RepID=UPI003B5125B0
MLVTGLDTETTGLRQEDGHRIVEIGLLTYELETQQLVDRYVTRINPERAIDADAQRVHGISNDMVLHCPKWEEVASDVEHELMKSDLIVIHNAKFDAPFVTAELERVGITLPATLPALDTLNARWATFDGKSPKLGELCRALGVPYDADAAHAAEYDIDRMMQCFFRGHARGFFPLDRVHPFAYWPR